MFAFYGGGWLFWLIPPNWIRPGDKLLSKFCFLWWEGMRRQSSAQPSAVPALFENRPDKTARIGERPQIGWIRILYAMFVRHLLLRNYKCVQSLWEMNEVEHWTAVLYPPSSLASVFHPWVLVLLFASSKSVGFHHLITESRPWYKNPRQFSHWTLETQTYLKNGYSPAESFHCAFVCHFSLSKVPRLMISCRLITSSTNRYDGIEPLIIAQSMACSLISNQFCR